MEVKSRYIDRWRSSETEGRGGVIEIKGERERGRERVREGDKKIERHK